MKNKILLLFGGDSVEHEISIITALQLLNNYKGFFELVPCYLKKGVFYFSEKLKKLSTFKQDSVLKKAKKVRFIPNQNYIMLSGKKIVFDAVLIVTHGALCEDGTLYSYFKTLNIDVIAQSPYSAVLGQDKILTKKISNLPSVPYFEIDEYDFSYNIKKIIDSANSLGFPLIIKPSNLGSSVGIKEIDNIDDLFLEIEHLLRLSNKLLIEKKITNFIELNVAAFLYEDEFIISTIEKVGNSKILTYDDKYLNNSKSMVDLERELPAIISAELEQRIIDYTKKAYRNLSCMYIVRFDYIYDQTNDILYLNEINNIPGSLSLYLFSQNTLKRNEIIDKYIKQGLMNIEKEKQIITSYEQNILKEKNFIFSKTNK